MEPSLLLTKFLPPKRIKPETASSIDQLPTEILELICVEGKTAKTQITMFKAGEKKIN